MRLDLPDGGWAELADPRKVPDKKRRAFIAAQSDFTASTATLPQVPNPKANEPGQEPMIPDPKFMTGTQTEMQFHALDLLAVCFVQAWSRPEAVSLEAIEDLDSGTKDMIVTRCVGFMPELVPNYQVDVDPKAPTSGSTGQPGA